MDRRIATLLLATGLAMVAAPARAQSFDCNKASAPVEILICEDGDLAGLDETLAKLYRERSGKADAATKAALRDTQRAWLRDRIRRCSISEASLRGNRKPPIACLKEQYRERLDVLSQAGEADSEPTPAPGRAGGEPTRQSFHTRSWPQDCERDGVDGLSEKQGLAIKKVSPTHSLVAVTCVMGAYQGSVLLLWWEHGKPPRTAKPMVFPAFAWNDRTWEPMPRDLLTTDWEWDDKTRSIAFLDRWRGIGDCGAAAAFQIAADGTASLSKFVGFPHCDGTSAGPETWPQIYP